MCAMLLQLRKMTFIFFEPLHVQKLFVQYRFWYIRYRLYSEKKLNCVIYSMSTYLLFFEDSNRIFFRIVLPPRLVDIIHFFIWLSKNNLAYRMYRFTCQMKLFVRFQAISSIFFVEHFPLFYNLFQHNCTFNYEN